MKRALRVVWRLIAAVTIALAVLVTALRLWLPHIDANSGLIARWASEYTGFDVAIDSIEGRWNGWAPALDLGAISIPTAAGNGQALTVERAEIRIRPIKSLMQRRLVASSLLISGIDLQLERTQDGALRLLDNPLPDTGDSGSGADTLLHWLLNRENLTIENARATLVVADEASTRYRIDDLSLRLQHRADRYLLEIGLRPPPEIGARLHLQAEIQGQIFSGRWQARVQARGRELRLDALRPLGLEAVRPDGRVDFQVAANLAEGLLLNLTGRIEGRDVVLGSERGARFDSLATDLSLFRHTDGALYLALRNLQVEAPGAAWPRTSADIVWRASGMHVDYLAGTAEFIALHSAVPIIAALLPDAELSERLRRFAPSGSARDVEFGLDNRAEGAPRYHVAGRLEDISWQRHESVPAVRGLSGTIFANRNGGEFQLAPTDVTLDHTDASVANFTLGEPRGGITWRTSPSGLQARSHGLSVRVESIPLMLAGHLAWPVDATLPTVDVVVRATGGNPTHLHYLLPAGVFKPSAENWVRRLYLDGTIRDLHVALRGPLQAFPFDNLEGVFDAPLAVSDTAFEYARPWPVARSADGEARLRGRELTVSIPRARVFATDIVDIAASVTDLYARERWVEVTGRGIGAGADARRIIVNSPLGESKLMRMVEMRMDGDLDMTAQLSIPLMRGVPPEVAGELQFENAQLHTQSDDLSLTDMSGSMTFTRQQWQGEDIRARFDGHDVVLAASGGLNGSNSGTEIAMTGRSNAAYVLRMLEVHARPVREWLERSNRLGAITGESSWRANLSLPPDIDDGIVRTKQLRLESDLQGLRISLPAPLGKTAREAKPLVIVSRFVNENPSRQFEIQYDGTLKAAIDARQTDRLAVNRVEILVGDAFEQPFSSDGGVSVHGSLQRLPLGEWIALTEGGGSGSLSLPVAWDVRTAQLGLFGQQFAGVRLAGERATGEVPGWSLRLDSLPLQGELHMDAAAGHLEAQFARLYLHAPNGEQVTFNLDPRALPTLNAHIDDFRFGEQSLGVARIAAEPDERGLTLTQLTFDHGRFDVHATGDWIFDDNIHISRFDIAARSANLNDLLTGFGYETGAIEAGETAVDIHAQWGGMPFEFGLPRLSGSLQLDVQNGRLLDVEPGGGRLFGLLSINSLGRRLVLDFQDVFAEGFVFERITGSFDLDAGDAYTNNLTTHGLAARVDVVGRIGLTAQDYDQRVTVTPEVSSTIPMASALFGPAGMGIGAAIYLGQQVFRGIPDTFDSMLRREYSITGSWKAPTVERIRYAQSSQIDQ